MKLACTMLRVVFQSRNKKSWNPCMTPKYSLLSADANRTAQRDTPMPQQVESFR